jgi:poly(glycerol-phosphate) alpha-glucosyltransferase
LSAQSSLHPSSFIPYHSPAPWTLAIAGWEEGGHEAELKRLCDELGLAWNDARDAKAEGGGSRTDAGSRKPENGGQIPVSVSFLGPQFGEAKAACYRESDAFVLPSFSEGLPMVVLEAWAYGKPVLMTPECNLPEGFAAGAAIRIETNVESIAAGLRKLFALSASSSHSSPLTPHEISGQTLTPPPLHTSSLIPPTSDLAAMGARGRELVRTRFTWPKIAADLRDVYTWLLGKGAKPECVRGKS